MGATDAAFEEERKAIEKRFGDAWGATTPVRYENAQFKETRDPHVALFILRGEGTQASLGLAPLRRWPGLIVVQIFIKAGTGTEQALLYANQAGAIFDRAEFAAGTSGLIRCRIPSIAAVTATSKGRTIVGGETAGWYQVNVSIPYIRDKAY